MNAEHILLLVSIVLCGCKSSCADADFHQKLEKAERDLKILGKSCKQIEELLKDPCSDAMEELKKIREGKILKDLKAAPGLLHKLLDQLAGAIPNYVKLRQRIFKLDDGIEVLCKKLQNLLKQAKETCNTTTGPPTQTSIFSTSEMTTLERTSVKKTTTSSLNSTQSSGASHFTVPSNSTDPGVH